MTLPSTLTVRIARKRQDATDICTLELAPLEAGFELPPFEAGSHIDLHLPGGLVRQYSLYGPPSDRQRYRLAILRDAASRGGSVAVHAALREGDTVTISAPRNAFALDERAGSHLLMAGGIGITPLLAMAEALHESGRAFELHVCARTEDRSPLKAHIESRPWASCVRWHLDDQPDSSWRPEVLFGQAPADRHVYVCGPSGFIDHVGQCARAAGWADARIHSESFQARALTPNGNQPFELELAGTGRVIPVGADQTALQALEAAGVIVPSSCEQGVCGTCLTRITGGVPDHRDLYLTPEEQAANDCFLPCCSRAHTPRLVVEL